MVELQLLSGMRPGEVIRLTPADIDFTGPVWVYRPSYHKLSQAEGPRDRPRAEVSGAAQGLHARKALRAEFPDFEGEVIENKPAVGYTLAIR
jgi:integrase